MWPTVAKIVLIAFLVLAVMPPMPKPGWAEEDDRPRDTGPADGR